MSGRGISTIHLRTFWILVSSKKRKYVFKLCQPFQCVGNKRLVEWVKVSEKMFHHLEIEKYCKRTSRLCLLTSVFNKGNKGKCLDRENNSKGNTSQ